MNGARKVTRMKMTEGQVTIAFQVPLSGRLLVSRGSEVEDARMDRVVGQWESKKKD